MELDYIVVRVGHHGELCCLSNFISPSRRRISFSVFVGGTILATAAPAFPRHEINPSVEIITRTYQGTKAAETQDPRNTILSKVCIVVIGILYRINDLEDCA